MDIIMLGKRIRGRRESIGQPLNEFSDRKDLHRSTLSRIENGKCKNPGIDYLIRIAEGLNVSLEYLVYGTEDIFVGDSELEEKYLSLTTQQKEYVKHYIDFLIYESK